MYYSIMLILKLITTTITTLTYTNKKCRHVRTEILQQYKNT